MGVWGLVAVVSTGAVVVVAIGLLGYAIYKSYASENEHTVKGSRSKNPGKGVADLVSYEDIKASDTGVRHRNVRLEQNKETKNMQTSDFQKDQNTALLNNPSNVEAFLNRPGKCSQETQTADNFLVPKFLSNNIGPNLNVCHHETGLSEVSSVISDGTESVCSFESMATVSSHTSSCNTCNFPIWKEMSDAERNCLMCRSCEEELVSTVTFPCKHPYLCGTCAPIFFSLYHRCPVCKSRIKSYDNVF